MKHTKTLRPLRPTDRSIVNPAHYVAIVGQTFVKRERQPILQIGGQTWDRWSLGRLGCPHPKAAAELNRVIAQLQITSLGQLADRAHEIGAYKGIGVTAYYTILAILREAGYDGISVHGSDITFATEKRQSRKHAKRDRRRLRRRRHPITPRVLTAAADTTTTNP